MDKKNKVLRDVSKRTGKLKKLETKKIKINGFCPSCRSKKYIIDDKKGFPDQINICAECGCRYSHKRKSVICRPKHFNRI